MTNNQGGKHIAQAILQVYSKVGYVLKSGYNSHQKYKFAGEDDFIKTLRPFMIEAGLVFYPTSIIGECKPIGTEEKPKNHAAYIYTFRILHAESGEFIEVAATGEGTGNDDKSSYKAATGALKYALRQAFMIETGDDPDKDIVVKKEKEEAAAKAEGKRKEEAGYIIDTGGDWTDYTSAVLLLIKNCTSFEQFNAIRIANKEGLATLATVDEKLRSQITEISSRKAAELKGK